MNFCESMFMIRSKDYTSRLNLNKTAGSSHFLLKLKKKQTRKASEKLIFLWIIPICSERTRVWTSGGGKKKLSRLCLLKSPSSWFKMRRHIPVNLNINSIKTILTCTCTHRVLLRHTQCCFSIADFFKLLSHSLANILNLWVTIYWPFQTHSL